MLTDVDIHAQLGWFDGMTGTEPFRFFVFVESGILVFPVRMGPLSSWGPVRGGASEL